jgi:ppGpp synthetase/RelA/SpoT-type nucleotidyltranferase
MTDNFQNASPEQGFDFAEHQKSAVAAYLEVQQFYKDLAGVIARIIEECLTKRGVKVHSVQYRSKDPNSFGRKAAIPSEADPGKPRYPVPLAQITDLAGIRVITHFPGTLTDIDRLLHEEFDVTERSDKGEELVEEDRFGYQSVHYLLRVRSDRARLAEYERFATAVTEVQVRTILQHAWAEIEHDIQYRSAVSIPTTIHRRFMALAGMLEIADREFQAVQDADRELTAEARKLVRRGELTGVEITPDALKLFLDKRLGPDARISDGAYDWLTRLLKKLGFRDLKQVENAVESYDDDRLSTLAMGARQGQATRFELMLLAALGEQFIQRHIFSNHTWFGGRQTEYLARFKESGIRTAIYDPVSTEISSHDGHQGTPPEARSGDGPAASG